MTFSAKPARPFYVDVNGRRFRISPYPESFISCDDYWTPVDCKDVHTRTEAQSIVLTSVTETPEALIKDEQTRDAIRSAYHNALAQETGHYPGEADRLPDAFTVTIIR